MDKKTILLILLLIGAIVLGIVAINLIWQKKSLSSPFSNQPATKQVLPSTTDKTYIDPRGFSFSYPDNLSLINNEPTDSTIYADIQLVSPNNGDLYLNISDSKFVSLDEWVKKNWDIDYNPPKETKLGNLRAFEITTSDSLLLGAMDEGVLFTVEIPLVEKDYWIRVYDKILESFSFTPPSPGEASTSNEVTFEGEEVVE